MEIRCGKCNKLFRISDDKIAGKGIKFACTKCGEYVKVTLEDFERYNLSLSAVSVLDTFVPKPKTPPLAPEPAKTESAEPKTAIPDAALPGPESTALPTDAPREPAQPESAIPDFLQEREEPAVFDSSPFIDLPQEPAQQPGQPEPANTVFEESPKASEQPQTPQREPMLPPKAATIEEVKPEIKPAPGPAPEIPVKVETPQPASELKSAPVAEPAIPPKPELKAEAVAEAKPEKKPEPKIEPKAEPPAQVTSVPTPQQKPKATPSAPAQARKRAPIKSSAGAAQRAVVSAAPVQKPRASNMTIVVVVAVLLLGLIGFGAYMLMQPKQETSSAHMTSIDGLRIENASGTPEANGDLLISGTVVNTTDKPQDSWLVVVDVYDAKGGVMKKLRLFKGKQLYTKSDYELLQSRGMNIQDQKAKLLSNQGMVIPPKGEVKFELRFLQPPIGMASFNPTLQPYDPVRLEKEIAADAK